MDAAHRIGLRAQNFGDRVGGGRQVGWLMRRADEATETFGSCRDSGRNYRVHEDPPCQELEPRFQCPRAITDLHGDDRRSTSYVASELSQARTKVLRVRS